MKAMILAAGVGSRLRPLTDETPKALIDVGGAPIIEHVIRRLQLAGVTEIVVNLFHLGDRIVEFLASKGNFGLHIALSRESELLDTGGGLKNAAWFFDDDCPFFLHNVDVLSEIDLGALHRFHQENGALVTLAVQSRPSSRLLLFEQDGRLCGREHLGGSLGEVVADGRRAVCGLRALQPDPKGEGSDAGFERVDLRDGWPVLRFLT